MADAAARLGALLSLEMGELPGLLKQSLNWDQGARWLRTLLEGVIQAGS